MVVAVSGDGRVRRLLDSLTHQTIPPDAYEVWIVENGSAVLADVDGLGGVVRYLHLPVANMAAARNVGLAAARGRFLLMTDADCVARPDWIEKMTTGLADGRFGAVGGAIEKYEPRTWTQRHAITVVDGQTSLNYLPALHLPYVAGANSGFVTEYLRRAGGFDEELRSGNDVDACYKLGLAGHPIGLVPDAVILHEDRSGLAAHFRRFRGYAVYQVLLFAKYRRVSGRRFVFDTYPWRRAGRALTAVPRALRALARGDGGPASRAALQLVEAAGVLVGELHGAIRFRQLYL
ncbi:glycosyltransferase [Plantactinospora sp. WMMC1484]|uniref:glycosyltransferase n=1 Tax=Plantactinospora sp. WMMC1484 TaxID=3404122 RepID=UPI003BF490A6